MAAELNEEIAPIRRLPGPLVPAVVENVNVLIITVVKVVTRVLGPEDPFGPFIAVEGLQRRQRVTLHRIW